MEDIFHLLENTFDKSVIFDLKKYLTMNKSRTYFIYSDYCLHDKNKPNDVVSFTISPYFEDFEKTSDYIEKIAKKDIKKVRNISDKFIEYMNKSRFFHISFVLKDTSGIIRGEKSDERKSVLETIKITKDMLKKWCNNTPENKEYYSKVIKKLNILQQEMGKKSANHKLYKDIKFVSFLAAYIAYKLTKEAVAEKVVWFSDRDKIVEAYNGIAHDLFSINHHSICYQNKLISEKTKLGLGIPDEGSTDLWYDAQNRMPDHLCGTLADWDTTNNKIKRTIIQHPFINFF